MILSAHRVDAVPTHTVPPEKTDAELIKASLVNTLTFIELAVQVEQTVRRTTSFQSSERIHFLAMSGIAGFAVNQQKP